MKYFIPFFILLSACSTFKPKSLDESLKPIRLEGEGRGRIGYYDQNYLFRFESLFKEKSWLLNLTIPMQGQEVLEFDSLDKKDSDGKMKSLEVQIDREIKKQTKLKELDDENIISHLRSLVRLIESQRLGLKTKCEKHKCILDDQEFSLMALDDGIKIQKSITADYYVEFSGLYLEGEQYSRSNFYLKKNSNKENLFSLELFWKNK